jgi:hypothetical protein
MLRLNLSGSIQYLIPMTQHQLFLVDFTNLVAKLRREREGVAGVLAIMPSPVIF